jgi:hypothetical protein
MAIRPMCQIVHLVRDRSGRRDGIVRGVRAVVVATALAKALLLAVEARRWDVVGRIAAESEGRRTGLFKREPLVKASRARSG